MLRQDPNDWANKKKAAVERAKQLRAERQQSSESHSFKPQINSRPAYLDKRTGSAGKGGDSLDHLTGNGGGSSDLFEQPLPGGRGGYQVDDRVDTLGQEVKKFPVGRGKIETKADLEYKSQFLQQYEKKHTMKSKMEAQPYAAPPEPVVKEADDDFMRSLRGGDDGGGWNNDTSFSGFDAAPASTRAARKPASGAKAAPSAGGADVAQARSRLSLLKSKIQRQTAAAPSSTDASNPSLLRSNSAHHLDDEYENGAFGQAPSVKPQRSNARAPRRREAEHSEYDTAAESSYPRSAPYQQHPRHAPNNAEDEYSHPPMQAKAPPRKPSNSNIKRQDHDAHHNDYAAQDLHGGGDIGPPAEAEYGGQQLECPDCHRKFNPTPYEKHVKICAKVFQQKRKVFDSTKMRVDDNPELLKLLKQKKKEEAVAARRKTKAAAQAEDRQVGGDGAANSKWKQQSSAFREAMRAARNVSAAQASGAPLPPVAPSAPDPSLIPCPHCGRRFNEKAAERHIPQCQNIRAKPTSLKRGTGGAGGKTGTIAAPAPASKMSRPPQKKR